MDNNDAAVGGHPVAVGEVVHQPANAANLQIEQQPSSTGKNKKLK